MKVGLLITARLKSSRLPLKLLMDLNGRSVVERVIDRAKTISGIDTIVLCTSVNSQDRPLADISLKNNIHYYPGDPDDVLKRLLDAARFFELDYIVSITGENPLFSVEYANIVVDDIKKTKADFVMCEGLPIGCAVYGLKTKALEVVCQVKKEVDTEIWGTLINRPEIFAVHKPEVKDFFKRPSLRITNDYLEDYMFLAEIFRHFDSNAMPSLLDVLTLLDGHPHIGKINEARVQAALPPETIKRIDEFFKQNKESILNLKSKIYASNDI